MRILDLYPIISDKESNYKLQYHISKSLLDSLSLAFKVILISIYFVDMISCAKEMFRVFLLG